MSKQKPLFHTFDLGGRQITLCVKRVENIINNSTGEYLASLVGVGYSVKVKEDSFNHELAEKISSGRADSKARLAVDIIGGAYVNTSVFKGIAESWQRKITNNPSKFIKGIKI